MQDAENVEAEATELIETTEKEVTKDDLDKLIRYHVWGAIGVSLIPIPVADFVALTAIQLNMLRKIAKVYEVPFFKDKVKNILSSLVGGALPATVAGPLATSLTKAIPVMGQTAGVITMPVVAGATTYAIGNVFLQHFASGGTFLTFDPEKVKAYYAEMFQQGEAIVKEGTDPAKEGADSAKEGTDSAKDKKDAAKDKKDAAKDKKDTAKETTPKAGETAADSKKDKDSKKKKP